MSFPIILHLTYKIQGILEKKDKDSFRRCESVQILESQENPIVSRKRR